ncbi:glutathione S-transferase family protein [Nisaea acidiphila]|uniref:Glutathione S-transferase family protein n=1 Tax=Nisaea acidiphila TaxID=1862145 RepID=A0A9J7ATU5_9PROT|nr:glutathione S-transferase family protein [Nisaea acidiphila]UUX50776.1 glutathione S-transferase family protein [Nisaea acidiphila]
MLKILGRNNSSNVQKVTWLCGELSIPNEREDFGGAFANTKDEYYLSLNPNSRVPTIIADDFVLWESNAIVRYLCNKYSKGDMAPADPRDYADADRWMDWKHTTLLPLITPIFWGLVRTPEAERDHAAIDTARKAMIDILWILEKRLTGRDYMMGDRLTMADIPLGMNIYRWLTLVEDRPAMPALEAWYGRIAARPAFKQHVLDIPLT